MANVPLSIGLVGITGHLLVIAREVDNPSVVAASLTFAPTHPATRNILFTGLNPTTHYFDFRESPDGSALGVLIAQYVIDAKSNTTLFERRFYTVNGGGAVDPIPGTSIVDSYLAGKNIVGVFKEGFRYLKYGSEYSFSGSTVSYLGGITLEDGETAIVEISYTTTVSASSNTLFPKDVIPVTANITLGSTHWNNIVEVNGSATIVTLTISDMLTVPNQTRICVNTHKGTQRYVAIQLPSGSYFVHKGQQRNIIWIGKNEELVAFKKDCFFYILSWTGDVNRVGEIVKSDMVPSNGISESGGWFGFNEYPRLFYWYVSTLDSSILGTGVSPTIPDAANRTKWIIDSVNQKFWLPDSGGYFDRNTDVDGNIDTDRGTTNNKPGNNQDDLIKSHSHGIPQGNSFTGTGASGRTGRGQVNPNEFNSGSTGGSETRPKNRNVNSYRIF